MRAATDWATILLLAAWVACGAWLVRWACLQTWARYEAWLAAQDMRGASEDYSDEQWLQQHRIDPHRTHQRGEQVSLRALLWALHDAPCTDPIDKLILLVLADHAGDDGANAFPAVSTIADTVPCDPATVKRHLRKLKDAGIIRTGDQAVVGHLRADRRPVVYDLPLPGRTVRPRPSLRGRTDPLDGGADGGALVRYEPKNQKMNQAQRAVSEEGKPVGCAAHGSRRPACEDCSRTNPGMFIKPAKPDVIKQLAGAARAGLK